MMDCTCGSCGHKFAAAPVDGHRILCGDATDKSAVERLMQGERAALCATDPPYGLGDTVSEKNEYDAYDDTRENLTKLIEKVIPLVRSVADCVVITPGVMNHRLYASPTWTMAWFTPAGIGMGPWGFCCWQPILCYGKDPKLAKGKGSYPDAIVHTESSDKSLGHPCAKPVNFWQWLVERTSEPGDLLFEPFSGSGTTIIVAEKTGRTCYAVEISPAYVDTSVERWQNYTGKKAVHAETGKQFKRRR